MPLLERLIVSTYQAVSGAGVAGVRELEPQAQRAGVTSSSLARDGAGVDFPPGGKWPVPIAFNVVPLNYKIVEDGYTEKEVKLRDESRKILEIPELLALFSVAELPSRPWRERRAQRPSCSYFLVRVRRGDRQEVGGASPP
jgi:aspartate-semialdehyde dehydrogenase